MVINFVMFLKQVDLYMHSSISNDDPEVAVMLEQCRVRLRDQINRVAEVKLLCIVQCIYIYNPSNLFAYARLAWTHHVTKYSPAKTGGYPRIPVFPNFQNCAHCEKDLKDNKDNSRHLGRKYARIFLLGHYLFLIAHNFPRKLFAARNR